MDMNKSWIVLKNELITVIARRSFILTLVLIPLIGFGITLIVSSLQPKEDGGTNPLASLVTSPSQPGLEGYVDESKIIKELPQDLVPRLKAFASQADALNAYQNGEITDFFIVSSDYLESGKITYANANYNPVNESNQTNVIRRALEFNLLGKNFTLLARIQNPMNVEVVSLANAPNRDSGNMLTFFLPYIVTMLFYIMIFGSSSLMLNSITSEKQNRVLEIIMTSVTPIQMLTGKIVALGLTGLLQTVVWSSAGLLLLRFSGQSLGLPVSFQLPTSILVWGAIFFILGYGLYGTLMAGLGALVPNLKEASQATMVMIVPMIVPLVFISNLISDSNGALSIGLSLFPLTAPVAMMTRLAAGAVAAWQLALAVVLLIASIALAIRSVAGMFRAQNLLSGQSFSLKLFLRALAGLS
jgi:ABC-2 type transport system permease protein